MKRIVIAALGVLAVSSGVYAQSNAQMIEAALMAAPEGRVRDGATVIKWNADYTYETLKEGENQIVCFDRSSEQRRQPFAVQCTSLANLDRVAQNRKFRAEAADAAGERAMVDAAEADGSRVQPEFGSMFYMMDGDDQASAHGHMMIIVPGATGESLGLAENGRGGGAWVMAAGRGSAHIMIPGF